MIEIIPKDIIPRSKHFLIIRKSNDFTMKVKEVELEYALHITFGDNFSKVVTPFNSLALIKDSGGVIIGYLVEV